MTYKRGFSKLGGVQNARTRKKRSEEHKMYSKKMIVIDFLRQFSLMKVTWIA